MGQNIRLTAADGHEMGAYLAEPSGPARGAIVVAMEMYGVNDYLRTVCDNYAADGYVAIAPQFFDRFAPDVNFPYDGSAYGLAKQYSADVVPHIVTDAEAAMAHVRAAGKVAISGYCFGGTVTWLAACRSDFDAAIAYYGSDMCDYPDEEARCPVICHVGDKDTAVPPMSRCSGNGGRNATGTSIPAYFTVSTTGPVRSAMTRRRQSWRAAGRWTSSPNISAERLTLRTPSCVASRRTSPCRRRSVRLRHPSCR